MNIPWYLARAAGLTAYLLLFGTVVLGLSIRTKGLDRYIARWKVTDIHIFLSLLVLGFAILHAGVLLWDGFVGYSILDVLVPFSTGYRTVWTAVGIVTLYALVVITLSFPARRYIGYRAWRMLHYGTFAAYVAALLHAIYTGTDSRVAWAQFIYIATAGTVLAMLIYRIAVWARRENAVLAKRSGVGSGRTASAAAWFAAQEAAIQRRGIETRALRVSLGAVCLTALVFIAAGLGPFRWGRSSPSGSPVSALAQSDVPFAAGPFTDTFSGTASETRESATETRFSLQGTATGDRAFRFDIELTLVSDARGGTTATANSIVLTDGDGGAECSGQLQQLNQSAFTATCAMKGGGAGTLQLSGSFDGGLANQVSGSLVGRG